MRSLFIIIFFLAYVTVDAQDATTHRYSVSDHVYYPGTAKSFIKHQYIIELSDKEITKKQVKSKLRLTELDTGEFRKFLFMKEIEDYVLDISFNRNKGFIKFKSQNDLEHIKHDWIYKGLLTTTCLLDDYKEYVNGHLNNDLFYIKFILNDDKYPEYYFDYSRESTQLEYKKNTSRATDQVVEYHLDGVDKDDFCWKIYNCIFDIRYESNEYQISRKYGDYEELNERAKSRMSVESYVNATREYLDKDLRQMNKFFENSLDQCLDEQDDIAIKISDLSKNEKLHLIIEKDVLHFPSYLSEGYKQQKRRIEIKQID